MDIQMYKDRIGTLIIENTKLKQENEELKNKIYFLTRNNKLEDMIDERDISDKNQMRLFNNDE